MDDDPGETDEQIIRRELEESDVDAERAGNRMRVAMVRLRALLARQVPGLPADVVRAERHGAFRLHRCLFLLLVPLTIVGAALATKGLAALGRGTATAEKQKSGQLGPALQLAVFV